MWKRNVTPFSTARKRVRGGRHRRRRDQDADRTSRHAARPRSMHKSSASIACPAAIPSPGCRSSSKRTRPSASCSTSRQASRSRRQPVNLVEEKPAAVNRPALKEVSEKTLSGVPVAEGEHVDSMAKAVTRLNGPKFEATLENMTDAQRRALEDSV